MAAMIPKGFTPNRLLNELYERLNVRNDQELAAVLDTAPSLISFFRCGVRVFSPGFLVAVLDAVPDITLAEIRRLAGMPREIK